MIDIITADGAVLHEGDRAFNYYDMQVGRIGKVDSYAQPDTAKGQDSSTPMEEWTNHWFDFIADGGGMTSLDGSRICTIDRARQKGWL